MVVGHLCPMLRREQTIAQTRYVDAVRDANCVHFAVVVLDVETERSAAKNFSPPFDPIDASLVVIKDEVLEIIFRFDHRDRTVVIDPDLEGVRVETDRGRSG